MKAAWILGLLAAAVVLLFVRLWDCLVCDRVSKSHCPACRDAGRVNALVRLTRRPTDPRVLSLLGSTTRVLAQSPPLDGPAEYYLVSARFSGDALLVVANSQERPLAGTRRSYAWIFDLQGARLDRLEAACDVKEGTVFAKIDDAGDLALSSDAPRFTLTRDGESLMVDAGDGRFRVSSGTFERIAP